MASLSIQYIIKAAKTRVVQTLQATFVQINFKTPAHPWHCRDTSEVKFQHLSPARSPVSQAPWGPGIQMTGALKQSALPKMFCRSSSGPGENHGTYMTIVERNGAVVKHMTLDREVPGSSPLLLPQNGQDSSQNVLLTRHWLKHGMEWIGMEWNGLDWIGMEWNGMDWIGLEWNGMEWNGMEWKWNGILFYHEFLKETDCLSPTSPPINHLTTIRQTLTTSP